MAKVYNANIGKIKELAKEKGIKMKYFCDQFGKHQSFMTDIKNGKNFLDKDQLQFIADELHTTVEYLTDQTEQKEKPIDQMTDEQIDMELVELLTSLDADDLRAIKAFIAGLKARKE